MGKTKSRRNTGRTLEKLIEIEENCDFPNSGIKPADLLISKFITSITDEKLRDKLVKERNITIPQLNEFLKQDTYDKKFGKNLIPKQTTESQMKTEPIQKVTKTETKNRKCFYCATTNWTPEHICPARKSYCNKCKKKGHFAIACKTKKITSTQLPENRKESEMKKTPIQTIHKISERTFYETKLTVDGKQINFVIDSGSPITIIPNHLKPDKPLQPVEQIYTDVNKNRVELDGKCMVSVETPTGQKQLELTISKRNDFTPLVGLNWFEELQIEVRTNNNKAQIRTVQSENVREQMHRKFKKLFEENTTIKDTKVKINLKPETKPVQQKARPIPLHLQDAVEKEIKKVN